MFRGAIATSIGTVEYINETINKKPASQFIILLRPVGIDKAFRLAVLVSFTCPDNFGKNYTGRDVRKITPINFQQ